MAARGDRGGGQRERQREQRVLELDHPAERHDAARAAAWPRRRVRVSCAGHPAQGRGRIADQRFERRGDVVDEHVEQAGTRAGGRACRAPRRPEGARAAARWRRPASARPGQPGSARPASPSRPTATGRAPRRGCRCRARARRPSATQRVDVGQAAADVQVRARAEHDRRAGLARDAPIVGAGVDHVHEQRRRLRLRRRPATRGTRPATCAGTRVAGRRPCRRAARASAGAVAQQRQLVLVLGDVDRRWRARRRRPRRRCARAARGRRSRGRAARARSRGRSGQPAAASARSRAASASASPVAISREPTSSWNSTPRQARGGRSPGAAASELPTSPMAAVPSATAAAAAVRGGGALRVGRCRSCGRPSASSPRRTGPCRRGRPSTCRQLQVAVRVDQARQQRRPRARSSTASGNSARSSARAARPPAPRRRRPARPRPRRSAARAIGTTQRALSTFTRRVPSAWPSRRRPAARSACCGGAA